ncbi:MAG: YfdQ family protein [Propionibacteriaceae bacterium]|nr:YfdQ family protein [Propionibacteriaceae bacterium]
MTTNTAEVIRVAKQAVAPQELLEGSLYGLLDADGGLQVVDTDAYAERPRRVHRSSVVADVASFLAYLDQYRSVIGTGSEQDGKKLDTLGLEVWADQEHLRVLAVIDGAYSDHESGWCDDQVTLRLTPTPEWEAFTQVSGKKMGQAQFAEFLEDHQSCIAAPDAATLLEIAQTMTGGTKVAWESAEWLQNGQRSFGWHEETEAKAGRKGTLEIPAAFTLGLRPFYGSQPWHVRALLRWQIRAGELTIGLRLVEPDRVIEQAFGEVVDQIRDAITTPVLMGRP